MAKSNKKYDVKKSKVQGDGAFAKQNLNPGDYVGKVHTILQPYVDYKFTELGRKHNHSDNPNVQNILIGNERHLVAVKPIKKGEELKSNYRLQPDLEQPEDFQKTKNGGWLDKYGEGGTMQEYQENYNDNSTSYPPGFVGMGNNTQGRNYSPAWGGQFQMGGSVYPVNYVPQAQDGLTFLEPNSPKLPLVGNRSELATSIGGENGEPAYLIPSFKYGKPLADPIGEFKKTGEHLGGPFKTWQEADEWENSVRHPYVEKGQSIPTPIRRWGKDFAMGGSLPGSVGFMYARTAGAAPSEGPYAKKTMPSAQDGMTYYQHGLDWKPRNISRDGKKVPKAQKGKQFPYHPVTNPDGFHPVLTDEQKRKLGFPVEQRSIMYDKPIVNVPTISKEQASQYRDRQNASVGPNRTNRTRAQVEAMNAEEARRKAQANSALAQTMGSFAGNEAAGTIGAETFVNMNPLGTGQVMSASRLYGLGKSVATGDSEANPYFGSDRGVVENTLGGLSLIGDLGMMRVGTTGAWGNRNPVMKHPSLNESHGNFRMLLAPRSYYSSVNGEPFGGAIHSARTIGEYGELPLLTNENFTYVGDPRFNVHTSQGFKGKTHSFIDPTDLENFQRQNPGGLFYQSLPQKESKTIALGALPKMDASGRAITFGDPLFGFSYRKNPTSPLALDYARKLALQQINKGVPVNRLELLGKSNPLVEPKGLRQPISLKIQPNKYGGVIKAQDGQEITNTWQPRKGSTSDELGYSLRQTITPYTSNRDIRRFTQTPKGPEDVNFLYNYGHSLGNISSFPTAVPYEDSKHWNVDRFIIDPQFGQQYSGTFNKDLSKEQNRANVLSDMYKYYMLQDPEHRGRSFRKAKRFVRNEIDPRTQGAFYDYYSSKEDKPHYNYLGIENFADQNHLKDLYWRQATGGVNVTPEEIEKLKNISIDYFRNYKKMSKKQADEQWKQWETDANNKREQWRKEQELDKQTDLTLTQGDDGGGWNVEYFDPTSNKPTTKKFNSKKEANDFFNSIPAGDRSLYSDLLRNKKQGGVIKDNRGQWAHPGEITEIDSNQITMQGVPYPVLGIGKDGQQIMMQPGEEYRFNKGPVTEIPMAQTGVEQTFQEGTDFLRDWYSKRAQLPQFKDLATRRLEDIDRFSPGYQPYDVMKKVGVGYYPYAGGDVVYFTDPADKSIPKDRLEESVPTPALVAHEVTHGLTRKNPQEMPEGYFKPVPFKDFDIYKPENAIHSGDEYYYNWINSKGPIEYINKKGKQKTKMAPGVEIEGTLAMLRSLEKLDPTKTYTAEDVVPMIEKYKGYQMENAPQMIEFMFRNFGNDPKRIAALLNDIVRTDSRTTPMAQKGGTLAPIYTSNPNDPRLKAYNDSLTLYKAGVNLGNMFNNWGTTIDQFNKKIDEEDKLGIPAVKRLFKLNGEFPNPTGTNTRMFPDSTGKKQAASFFEWKKPVQPVVYKKEKPQLKKVPYNPETIKPTRPEASPIQIRPIAGIPQAQMEVPDWLYRVEYTDPETGQKTHRMFNTEKEGSEFQRMMDGERIGNWEKQPKKKTGGWLDKYN
jgi:hypothetical protein